ncbi:MAG: hypothetical protein Ct9H90mP10_08490 [Actinomycetota bacterium]|nr:MAG: hypothetical protein Ct9H90mP10_08490 [Actinomycetota bacterium]
MFDLVKTDDISGEKRFFWENAIGILKQTAERESFLLETKLLTIPEEGKNFFVS